MTIAASPAPTAKIPPVILIGIGVIATLISVWGSWIPSFWGDEAASIMSAERSWSSLWAMLGTVDAVHGLYYAFLHVWIDLFGASPVSVRLPSAIAVGLAASGLAVLGSRLARPGVGVVAAILFMTLPRVTYYGTETRAYAFTMALVIGLLLVLITLVARRETRILPWVGFTLLFTITSVLFIYTVLFIVVFAVIVIAMRPGSAVFWRAALWSSIGALLAVPVLIFAYLEREQIAFLHSRNGFTVKALFETPWFMQPVPAMIGWSLIGLAVVIGIPVLLRARRGTHVRPGLRQLYIPADSRLPGVLLVGLTWLVVPSVLLALGTSITPLYSPRYLAFTAPAVALLMAVGLIALARLIGAAWLVPILVVAVVAASAPVYFGQRTPHPRNGGTDWNLMAEAMAEHARPGDAVIYDATAINARKPRVAQYLYPEAFSGLRDIGLKTRFDDTDGLWDVSYSLAESIGRLDDASSVWLIRVTPQFSTDQERSDAYQPAIEAAGYEAVQTIPLHRSVLIKFERVAEPAQ